MSKYNPIMPVLPGGTEEWDVRTNGGSKGESLYKLRGSIWWYIGIIAGYTLLFIGMAIWTFAGPNVSSGKQLLYTGNTTVDQFYSGLVLSAVLAPAGIITRRLANEFGLLHPF